MNRDALVKQIVEMIDKNQSEMADKIYKELTSEDYGWERGVHQKCAALVAERYVTEHYDKIAELINLERVAKMAELQAVGRSLGNQS